MQSAPNAFRDGLNAIVPLLKRPAAFGSLGGAGPGGGLAAASNSRRRHDRISKQMVSRDGPFCDTQATGSIRDRSDRAVRGRSVPV